MSDREAVPVRFPAPGETLRLWPLVARGSWYRVHTMGCEGVLPCVGAGCLLGCTDTWSASQRWEGYVLCCMAQLWNWRLVLRLPPGLWDTTAELHSPAADYQTQEWVVYRHHGRGSPRLSLKVVETGRVDMIQALAHRTVDHLYPWWPLPAEDPDYRQRVYQLGDGLPIPGGVRRTGRLKEVTS